MTSDNRTPQEFNENSKVYKLSDAQLLQIIRGRANGLMTANKLAKLVQMLQLAKEKTDDIGTLKGLDIAISLCKLYSQTFAPGHEEHPFRDYHDDIEVVLGRLATRVKSVQNIPKPDTSVNKPSNLHRAEGALEVKRRPGPIPVMKSPRGESKMGLVIKAIDDYPHTNLGTSFQCIKKLNLPPYIYVGDVANALNYMRRTGKIANQPGIGYIKVPKLVPEGTLLQPKSQDAHNLTVESP